MVSNKGPKSRTKLTSCNESGLGRLKEEFQEPAWLQTVGSRPVWVTKSDLISKATTLPW